MIMKHALHSEGPLFIGFIYIKLCFGFFFSAKGKMGTTGGDFGVKGHFFFVFFANPKDVLLQRLGKTLHHLQVLISSGKWLAVAKGSDIYLLNFL